MTDERTTVEIPISGHDLRELRGAQREALRRLAGVSAADVNFATEKATVTFDPAQVDVGRLTATIEQAGYDVARGDRDAAIGGMTCASCVSRIEKALQRVPGVLAGRREPGHREGHRRVPAGRGRPRRPGGGRAAGRLRSRARRTPPAPAQRRRREPARDPAERRRRRAAYLRLRRKVVVGSRPVERSSSWAHGIRFVPPAAHQRLGALGARHAGAVLGRAGSSTAPPWRRRATAAPPWTRSSRWARRRPTSTAPPACSFPAFFDHHGLGVPMYFDSAALIITLILLGKLLEARAKGQTGEAIKRADRPAAKTARVVRDGVELDVPVAEVRARRHRARAARREDPGRRRRASTAPRRSTRHAHRREPAGREGAPATRSSARP